MRLRKLQTNARFGSIGTACIVLSTIFSSSAFQVACAQDSISNNGATPSQIYLNFHEKMLGASSVDDLCPMFAANRVEQIKNDKKNLPPQQIKEMFQFMQKVSPRKVRILGEAINNDTCTLTLDAPGYKDPIFGDMASAKKGTVGKISLVREDGQWKIEKESWMSAD